MSATSPSLGLKHVPLLLDKIKDLVEAVVTTDGKHIVTAARLRGELVEAVSAAGGRASSRHLAAVVGVDDATIRATIRPYCAEHLHGRCVDCGETLEIVTNAYLASLAREADTVVAKLGWVTLQQLASTFKLPVEFTEALVSQWMERDQEPRLLAASGWRLVNGTVMSEAYETTTRAALNALCSTATGPRPVEELMQACDLHPDKEEMALKLLKGLTKSGQLKGSLTAGDHARAYVPDSFVAAQHEAAYAFFSANGYLDNATASELQVRKLHPFIKEKHPNAVCLETVAVSRPVVEQLEAVADGVVAEASWFEAWAVVPTILSDADAAHLVGMCAACKRADGDPLGAVQLGVYGVSTRFVQGIVNRFREEVALEVNHAAFSSDVPASEGKQPGGSGSSSRKGRGKHRKRGGSTKADSDCDLISDTEAESFLRACKPELDDFPRLVAALGAHLAPTFRESKMEAIRRAQEVKRADSYHGRADAFEATFERSYLAFQLHCRGVQALRQSLLEKGSVSSAGGPCPDPDADASDAAATQKSGRGSQAASDACSPEGHAEAHLLRTLGAQLAELVTARECEKLGIPFALQDRGEGRQQPEQRIPVITKEASSALSEVLPGDVASPLVYLWQAAMTGSQLSTFCETLEGQVFPACNLVGRRLDKRRERQLVADRQRATKESLFQSVSERDVLHYATLLVFQNATGGFPLLPLPTSSPLEAGQDRQVWWARVLLNAIRRDILPEAGQCLSNLQRDIEASAAATARDTAADGDQGEEASDGVESGGTCCQVSNTSPFMTTINTGLISAPVQGFVAPCLLRSSALQLRDCCSSCGNGFLGGTQRQQPVGGFAGDQRRTRGVRSLSMTKPNFIKTAGVVLIVASTVGVSAIPFLAMGPEVSRDPRPFVSSMKTATLRKGIPVFFLRDESGAVHTENGEGLFFMSPGDAKEKLQELKGAEGTKVSATTLDDVWFPLIKKKGLNKKPVGAEASGLSDLSATYRIIPRASQISQALETQGWNTVADAGGVPVWAAETLAFRGSNNKMKMPLFTNVDDLMTSWNRLDTEAGSEAKSPKIQVSSIGAIIDIMQRGGGDNRNLEFFADMEAIEQAEKLL
ncbi:unnamed protein product [Pylaiella littoralis]